MSATDKLFTGSIPEAYDRFLVPLIFEPYARDLAERLADVKPPDALETAAGPAWRQADVLALPFEDQTFDVVACQFGVMFFPDKVKGYREARRVLKPGGRSIFNVWDRISDNEFAFVVTEALKTSFPGDPANFLARTPHGYYDIATITEELRAAGFSAISIETSDHTSRAASPRDAAIAYCHGTPLRNEIEVRDPAGLEKAPRQSADALARRFGNGPIADRIRAHVVIAIR